MLPCDLPGVTRETVGTENFAAYRTYELSVGPIVTEAKKTANPARRFLRRDYCRCHELLPRASVRLSLRVR